MKTTGIIVAALAGLATILVIGSTFHLPPVESVQRGYRGLGMEQNYVPAEYQKLAALNQMPVPDDPQEKSGQKSSEVYQNVQVLGDVDANEFLRLMNAITAWVSPEQGCTYCHVEENLALDTVYTKVVARKMLQMTININKEWKSHVQQTGVTCYTCHRGNPVPKNVWFQNVAPPSAGGFTQVYAGQNHPAREVGVASLPVDVFTPFLHQAKDIRVIGKAPLPEGNYSSIKQAEWTYGLMMHFSQSLGVNCTYCHNSRSFAAWDQSTPQRNTAWYGIRMVRNINNDYLDPLTSVFPAARLGVHGDVAKTNCTTCHQGVYKPLFGQSMLKDYLELSGAE